MLIIKTTSQIFLCTFSLLSLAYANSSNGFDGIYIGLNVGGDFGSVKVNTLAFSPNLNIADNQNLSAHGVVGGIYAGYGVIVGGIYIGAELAGELYSSNGNTSINFVNGVDDNRSISFKRTNSFSIAGRFGKQIGKETLFYAKGGVAVPQYRLATSLNGNGAGAGQLTASATANKRLAQGIGGLGIEHTIGKVFYHSELRCGVEYEHTFARKINLALNSNTFTSANTTFSPSVDSIKFKLIFKF